MRSWSGSDVAAAAGAELVRAPGAGDGPERAVIDSRAAGPGDLFVGLPGAHVDGGSFAAAALEAGAWGVLVAPEWGRRLGDGRGAVLTTEDPLAALAALARAWRRQLRAQVIGVTGSVGKTSTKDLIAAMVGPHRSTVASRANFNTEIGLPLEILAAPAGTDVLVLEMGMRGFGQIAELAAIAEPDVGVITNVGPVHVEKVGSLEGVAQAKAELLGALRAGGTAVVPAGEHRLERWLRADLEILRFGRGGDVELGGDGAIVVRGERLDVELPFAAAHQRLNALAAAAAAVAIGVKPSGVLRVAFGALRGERVALPSGAELINDCYNANPLSMRAALDDLAAQDPAGRRVAVLGDMLELGPDEERHHREVGEHASRSGVEVLVAVGPRARATAAAFAGESHTVADAAEAAEVAREVLRPGDLALVKASRGVGLEVVAERLLAAAPESPDPVPGTGR